MDVVFFGTPEFAVSSLKALIKADDVNVIAVVTQPDQVLGRKRVLTPTPVKALAIKYGLPVFQPKSRRELYDMVSDFDCDFFIVVAFGMILRQKVLDIPKIDTLNVHGSVLPNYRGPSPIHFALLNGDKKTGVTVMSLDAKMDHGPVYASATVEIELDDDFSSLYNRLANIGADLLVDVLPEIKSGELISVEQDHFAATYCSMIKKEDSFVDFAIKTSDDILNMIRAYSQWPFTFIGFENKKLKIVEAEKYFFKESFDDTNLNEFSKSLELGSLFSFKKYLYLKTKDSVLRLIKVQLPGKNVIDYKAFLNGAGRNIIRL